MDRSRDTKERRAVIYNSWFGEHAELIRRNNPTGESISRQSYFYTAPVGVFGPSKKKRITRLILTPPKLSKLTMALSEKAYDTFHHSSFRFETSNWYEQKEIKEDPVVEYNSRRWSVVTDIKKMLRSACHSRSDDLYEVKLVIY